MPSDCQPRVVTDGASDERLGLNVSSYLWERGLYGLFQTMCHHFRAFVTNCLLTRIKSIELGQQGSFVHRYTHLVIMLMKCDTYIRVEI